MKILDIGGGFNGCETQLELVGTLIFRVDCEFSLDVFNTAAV